MAGQSHNFTCKATGHPEPKIIWTYKMVSVINFRSFHVYLSGADSGLERRHYRLCFRNTTYFVNDLMPPVSNKYPVLTFQSKHH